MVVDVLMFLFSCMIKVPELPKRMALSKPALQIPLHVGSRSVAHVYGHGTKYKFLDAHLDEVVVFVGKDKAGNRRKRLESHQVIIPCNV